MALPQQFYRNPEEALSRLEACQVYRRERCAGCVSFDMTCVGDPCKKRIQPGRRWCNGFEEK